LHEVSQHLPLAQRKRQWASGDWLVALRHDVAASVSLEPIDQGPAAGHEAGPERESFFGLRSNGSRTSAIASHHRVSKPLSPTAIGGVPFGMNDASAGLDDASVAQTFDAAGA
jgi:hypothetical protein